MPEEKHHWYAFSFQSSLATAISTGSIYIGYEDQMVNLARIKSAKEAAKMPADSVLMSVSYLGHMTRDVMAGPITEPV